MPPKRKQAAAAAPKPATKRRSKLAKDNDISADEEAEIKEAFELFAAQSEDVEVKAGEIATSDVRRCLIALNAPPTSIDELQELLGVADPDNSGSVSYAHFLPVAAVQMNRTRGDDDGRRQEEVDKAYRLFTKGEGRPITIHDLKRIATELREDVPDAELKDMVREATGGGLGAVGKEDFENVMRRAGVFS